MSKKRLKSDKLSSKKCAVASCDSENKIVYDFPHPAKNRKQFFEWLSFCKNDEVENMDVENLYNLHGICEKHFERRTANIHDSVPTLDVPANNGPSLKNEVCEASQLCRLCFNTGSVDVFSCKYYKKLLRDIVKTFIPIEIKKNDVSTLVCEYCKCEVIRFYNFLLKSLQVDEYFRAISKEIGNDEEESFGSLMLVEPNVSLIKIEEDEEEVFTAKEEEGKSGAVFAENETSSSPREAIDNKSPSLPKVDADDSDNKTESDNEEEEDGNYVPPYVIQYFHTYVKRPNKERAKNKRTKAEILNQDLNEIIQDGENGDTIICIHCDKTIESIEEFREHCKSENHSPLFTCPECNRIFKDQIALDMHSTVHGKDNSGICDRCGKQFNKRDRLYNHINSVHNKSELKFECKECPRKFATNYRLKMHMRIHNNDRPYCCEQCGAVFTMSTNLRNHQMIHSDHKPFVCVICNKGFRRRSKLAIHLTKHTGERKYSCEKCGIAYKRKLNLIRHNKKNHTNPNEEIDEKPRVCTQCNFVCNFSAQLKYHMLKVHKSYTCTICNMSFKNYQPYYNHKFKHYPNKKKFVCKYCDKRFINATLLSVHMVVHTGKKNFECEICNKKFSQRPHLQSHLLTHTGEKPHKCKFCNKSFAHLSTLVVHERIHTGETPYVCHICKKGFGHLTNYKKHLFSQHGVIIPKKRDYSKLKRISQESHVEDTASELIDFLKLENEEVIIEGDIMEVTEGSIVEVAEDVV